MKKTKSYEPKRIKCELCIKKFNKKETFNKHMKEAHKMSEDRSGGEGSKIVENESQKQVTFQRNLRSLKKTESAIDLTFN